MSAPSNREIQQYLDQLAAEVSDWDAALIRQAVLVTALRNNGQVSANDFREYLPEVAQSAVGLIIRQLPTKAHGQLTTKALTSDGYPMTVPSSAPSTHGKALQVWRLTGAGRDMARRLLYGEGVAA